MKRTELKRRTPLKRVSFLAKAKDMPNKRNLAKPNPPKVSWLARMPIRKVSKKQARENALWAKITELRRDLLITKFGYLLCELCKQAIERGEGHHNNHDRTDNTPQNCRVLCHNCNCYVVEDNNIKDVPNLL